MVVRTNMEQQKLLLECPRHTLIKLKSSKIVKSSFCHDIIRYTKYRTSSVFTLSMEKQFYIICVNKDVCKRDSILDGIVSRFPS